MTRALLAGLAESRVSTIVGVALALVALAALPFTIVYDGFASLTWWMRVRTVLGRGEVRCPRGHVVAVGEGSWSCSCGTVFDGHGFADCPMCGARGHATCACGLTVENPLRVRGPS